MERLKRGLNYGKTDTVYLLIDIERIDVCHPADEVEHCHDTCFKTRTLDVILT